MSGAWLAAIALIVDPIDEAARLSASWIGSPPVTQLIQAAATPWPLLPPEIEKAVADRRDELPAEVRRSWWQDRALPVTAGLLPISPEPEPPPLSWEEARLTAARSAYARGDWSEALALYGSLPVATPGWAAAQPERAWSAWQAGDREMAAGIFVSLEAPYFAAAARSEGRLLEAMALVALCRFEEARARVAILVDTSVESAEPTAGDDPVLRRLEPYRHSCRRSPAPGTEETCARVDRLSGERVGMLQQQARESAHAQSRRALAVIHDALLAERLMRERGQGPLTPKGAPVQRIGDDEVRWTQDGRYWRDELGRYRRSLASACPPGYVP